MTPEITLADLAELLKLVQATLTRMERQLAVSGKHARELQADMARVTKLADEAAPFLESPLANYMRTRRRLRQEAAGDGG